MKFIVYEPVEKTITKDFGRVVLRQPIRKGTYSTRNEAIQSKNHRIGFTNVVNEETFKEIVETYEKELKDFDLHEKRFNITLHRVNHDTYGNPRVVVHYLAIDDNYKTALEKARTIGGSRYRAKSFGGGIVFQCWNGIDLKDKIINLRGE